MAVLAVPLFRLLFTDKWLPAVPYFQILCINGILYPIHSYNLQILNVKGRSDLFLKLEIVKKILIVIVILVSFRFGIFGLLYGSVISSVFSFFINTHYSGRFLNYSAWEQTKDIVPFILFSLISGVGAFLVDSLLYSVNLNDFIRLLIGGTIGCVLYGILSHVFKIKSLQELKTIILRK